MVAQEGILIERVRGNGIMPTMYATGGAIRSGDRPGFTDSPSLFSDDFLRQNPDRMNRTLPTDMEWIADAVADHGFVFEGTVPRVTHEFKIGGQASRTQHYHLVIEGDGNIFTTDERGFEDLRSTALAYVKDLDSSNYDKLLKSMSSERYALVNQQLLFSLLHQRGLVDNQTQDIVGIFSKRIGLRSEFTDFFFPKSGVLVDQQNHILIDFHSTQKHGLQTVTFEQVLASF